MAEDENTDMLNRDSISIWFDTMADYVAFCAILVASEPTLFSQMVFGKLWKIDCILKGVLTLEYHDISAHKLVENIINGVYENG